MLLRPALFVLSRLYAYCRSGDFAYRRLTAEDAAELRLLRDLVLIAEVDMCAPWAPVAYCSDACPSGYALAVSTFDAAELEDVSRFREKWRFRQVDPYADDIADDLGPGTSAEWTGGLQASPPATHARPARVRVCHDLSAAPSHVHSARRSRSCPTPRSTLADGTESFAEASGTRRVSSLSAAPFYSVSGGLRAVWPNMVAG